MTILVAKNLDPIELDGIAARLALVEEMLALPAKLGPSPATSKSFSHFDPSTDAILTITAVPNFMRLRVHNHAHSRDFRIDEARFGDAADDHQRRRRTPGDRSVHGWLADLRSMVLATRHHREPCDENGLPMSLETVGQQLATIIKSGFLPNRDLTDYKLQIEARHPYSDKLRISLIPVHVNGAALKLEGPLCDALSAFCPTAVTLTQETNSPEIAITVGPAEIYSDLLEPDTEEDGVEILRALSAATLPADLDQLRPIWTFYE